MAPKKRQAIIWTDADPVPCCIYAVLGVDELSTTKEWNWFTTHSKSSFYECLYKQKTFSRNDYLQCHIRKQMLYIPFHQHLFNNTLSTFNNFVYAFCVDTSVSITWLIKFTETSHDKILVHHYSSCQWFVCVRQKLGENFGEISVNRTIFWTKCIWKCCLRYGDDVTILFRPQFVNTLRPKQNRRLFAEDIFKCIFLKEIARILLQISLKCVLGVRINNIPALAQIMAWRPPGDKPLSEPMMFNLLTHICVDRSQ